MKTNTALCFDYNTANFTCYWSAGSVRYDGARWIVEIESSGHFLAHLGDGPPGSPWQCRLPTLAAAQAYCQAIDNDEPTINFGHFTSISPAEVIEAIANNRFVSLHNDGFKWTAVTRDGDLQHHVLSDDWLDRLLGRVVEQCLPSCEHCGSQEEVRDRFCIACRESAEDAARDAARDAADVAPF